MESTSRQPYPYNFKSLSSFIKMSKTCWYSTRKMRQKPKAKRKKNITLKQSVVTQISSSLIFYFIRRSDSLGVALLSAHNSTNMLPPPAFHALINLSKGLLGFVWTAHSLPLLSLTLLSELSLFLISCTHCKKGSTPRKFFENVYALR
jgi:hypothetical protein